MVCSAKHIGGSSPVASIQWIEQLAGTADAGPFKTIASNPNHSLYQILPHLDQINIRCANVDSAA